MAIVRGVADLSATTVTIIITGNASKDTVVNVGMTNRDSANTPAVRLGVMDSDNIADISNEDWYLEYDTGLFYGQPIGHTKVLISAGHSLVAYSSLANVSVGAHGFEETA